MTGPSGGAEDDATTGPEGSDGATAITETVGDATNVLLLAPAMNATADAVCRRHLSERDASVLVVSYATSGDQWARGWRANVGDLPSQFVFVHVGGVVRSVADTTATLAPSEGQVLETVGNAADLTGLGITMNRHLTRWQGAECRKAVCFRSLTALLQYVDVRTAYRFLQVLTSQVAASGAVGHYHLSPDAHDEADVNALASLFDASVTVEDGAASVNTR